MNNKKNIKQADDNRKKKKKVIQCHVEENVE